MDISGTIRLVSDSLIAASLVALPHGGQRSARRNAWTAIVADTSQARARQEAKAALDHAVAQADRAVAVVR